MLSLTSRRTSSFDVKQFRSCVHTCTHIFTRVIELSPLPCACPTQAATAIDWSAVQTDLKLMLVKSQDEWPADYGNYGPLFVCVCTNYTAIYAS